MKIKFYLFIAAIITLPNRRTISKYQPQQGLTLIELLIVTSLTSLLLITASSVFMTFLITNTKLKIENDIQQVGNFALEHIATQIRNAKLLNSECLPDMDQVSITNFDNTNITFYQEDRQILANHTSNNVTISKIIIDTSTQIAQQLKFACYQGEQSKYLEISFALKIGNQNTSSKDTAIAHFHTGVELRN